MKHLSSICLPIINPSLSSVFYHLHDFLYPMCLRSIIYVAIYYLSSTCLSRYLFITINTQTLDFRIIDSIIKPISVNQTIVSGKARIIILVFLTPSYLYISQWFECAVNHQRFIVTWQQIWLCNCNSESSSSSRVQQITSSLVWWSFTFHISAIVHFKTGHKNLAKFPLKLLFDSNEWPKLQEGKLGLDEKLVRQTLWHLQFHRAVNIHTWSHWEKFGSQACEEVSWVLMPRGYVNLSPT